MRNAALLIGLYFKGKLSVKNFIMKNIIRPVLAKRKNGDVSRVL